MRLNAADFYLKGSLKILPFMYTSVKGTWKSPVLMSGSMMLPLRPSPQLLRMGGTGAPPAVLPVQQPRQEHPKTALQLKLHTVADERGGKKHHGAAAQGIHGQKSLTTKGLSADSTWVCKGSFPAGCHANNVGWILM